MVDGAAVSTVSLNNVRELIEHARKNPGKLNLGPGRRRHRATNGELAQGIAGIDSCTSLVQEGADLVQALRAGQCRCIRRPVYGEDPGKAGKAKIVAIAEDKRAVAAPGCRRWRSRRTGAYVSGGITSSVRRICRARSSRAERGVGQGARMQDVDETYTSTVK